MTLNPQNGTNSTQFKDLGTRAGLQAIMCTYMEDLNMKFQIFHSAKFARSILKNCLQETIIFSKKLSLQKRQAKKEIRTKRRESRKTPKTITIWRDNSNFRTKLILPLLRSNLTK